MSIITLTTDWGLKDYFAGAVKGKLINQLPDVRIVDISHEITPFSIEQAAFILKNCYRNFPSETIHIIGVNTEESDKNAHVVVRKDEQYFIGTDNGLFSMLFDENPDEIYELNISQDTDYFTFATRDRFVKAAVHLAQNKKIADLGDKRKGLVQKMLFQPVFDNNMIKGMVIYVDGYENLITNITENLIKEKTKGKKYNILLRGEHISNIHKSYNDVPVGEIIAIFGTGGHLEIAINQGNASSLLGIRVNDPVMIEIA